MHKVIVFDLDDTLFSDRSYVLSGFHAVAQFLSPLLNEPVKNIERDLAKELDIDRNKVFNRYLLKKKIFSKKLVLKCLSVYRAHKPKIKLFPEAVRCLKRFRNFPLYVLTDGNKIVQKNKFLALGLQSKVKRCLFTNVYGLKHNKPSPYCFFKICEWEQIEPEQLVYVADNPNKDFIGIKPYGFHTIRVLTGRYRDVVLATEYEAEKKIHNLDEFV